VQLSQRSKKKPCQGGIVLAWLDPVMQVVKAAPQDRDVLLNELVAKFEELGSYSKAGWDAAFDACSEAVRKLKKVISCTGCLGVHFWSNALASMQQKVCKPLSHAAF
jgi:hypothetical protein